MVRHGLPHQRRTACRRRRADLLAGRRGAEATRYTRTKSDPGGQLKVTAGEREVGATLDADGRTRDVTFKAGASTVHIERIFTRGKL